MTEDPSDAIDMAMDNRKGRMIQRSLERDRSAREGSGGGEVSESKHTPGPWSQGKPGGSQTTVYAMRGDWRQAVVSTFSDAIPDDECLANAALIAAAPEMYEALHLCEAALTKARNRSVALNAGHSIPAESDPDTGKRARALSGARAAIAKADGAAPLTPAEIATNDSETVERLRREREVSS